MTAATAQAALACDDRAAVEAQRYRFLATGRLDALFQTDAAAPLSEWARFFGYLTQ